MSNMQNKIWQSRWNAMKFPWRTARNLNRIGGSMKRAQEICRGRERVKVICFNYRLLKPELYFITPILINGKYTFYTHLQFEKIKQSFLSLHNLFSNYVKKVKRWRVSTTGTNIKYQAGLFKVLYKNFFLHYEIATFEDSIIEFCLSHFLKEDVHLK